MVLTLPCFRCVWKVPKKDRTKTTHHFVFLSSRYIQTCYLWYGRASFIKAMGAPSITVDKNNTACIRSKHGSVEKAMDRCRKFFQSTEHCAHVLCSKGYLCKPRGSHCTVVSCERHFCQVRLSAELVACLFKKCIGGERLPSPSHICLGKKNRPVKTRCGCLGLPQKQTYGLKEYELYSSMLWGQWRPSF